MKTSILLYSFFEYIQLILYIAVETLVEVVIRPEKMTLKHGKNHEK
jgi:hypothetical protein